MFNSEEVCALARPEHAEISRIIKGNILLEFKEILLIFLGLNSLVVKTTIWLAIINLVDQTFKTLCKYLKSLRNFKCDMRDLLPSKISVEVAIESFGT